jgi:acid phosphatase (class A)
VLQANETFRRDFEAARLELADVRERGLAPSRDCDAEAEALAVDIWP